MSSVTLDNCEREPIHIPGAIQGHGVLLSCRGDDLIVQQASANTVELLGAPADEILGLGAPSLFDEVTGREILRYVDRTSMPESRSIRFVARSGCAGTAIIHFSGEALVLELEPGTDGESGTFDPRLRRSLAPLQSARSVEALSRSAANEVRSLTGFDRVMVYRFDSEWNGEVVAEAKRDNLEPFLGLHYPASDIPPQARRLYTENWLRLIADVAYTPVPLVPLLDPKTREPLDLSQSVLRSVSPIHIEYLKNMGVTASMSISLVIDGKLTGLIACHHYSGPHRIPFQLRETVEYLGQALSWHVRALESAEDAHRARRVQANESEVVRALAMRDDPFDGLASESMLELTGAQGLWVIFDDEIRSFGRAPSQDRLSELVAWLKSQAREVFATDHLASHLPRANEWDDIAAGVIAVALSADLSEWLIWFRPSTERTVEWAGDPRKSVTEVGGEPPRLSPRGSFALWRETVRGRSLPWEAWQIEAASNIRRVLLGGVRNRAKALRALNGSLMEADRAKDTFIAMVSHELRTPLNAIKGWSHLLASDRVQKDQWAHALDVIGRNSEALNHLVDDLLDMSRIVGGKLTLEVSEVELSPLVDSVIEAVSLSAKAKGIKVKKTLDSAETRVQGDPDRLAQVVTNLLTNAVKFTPKGGTVRVVVKRSSSDVEICVNDSGQGISGEFLPFVFEWFRQADGAFNRRATGLGLGLAITKRLVELHGGTITAESEGTGRGATFRVRLPMASVRQRSEHDSTPRPPPPAPLALREIRALVIDDERDSRELLAHVLTLSGAQVTQAADAPQAIALLSAERFDVIVSDVGMPDMDGFELIAAVRTRSEAQGGRTPAIALTAYSRASDRMAALRAGFQAHVAKPADPEELVAIVASIVGRKSVD